ncbi:MAG: hypothetical protein GYB49_09400 [Alphaproteobacteria bacterium]|nr:hypothetical protein [Hyphomonas sp.]MBR9807424.1 hypothetical protein [Alphaproteobacteria bacterium]|tara:strand:- start:147 stop:566 length:420 start_codon:yes stop_codon:yes gene_type:complete
MAKDAKDKSSDAPTVFTPATKSDLRTALDNYEAINTEKSDKADAQKTLLERFNEQHSLPPWIFKIVRKFDKLEQDDSAESARSKRALIHALEQLGIGRQTDIEDFTSGPANDPDGDGGASAVSDEEWDDADPNKDQDAA